MYNLLCIISYLPHLSITPTAIFNREKLKLPYFGLKHLGAISGKMTSGMVISSGLGSLLMAWSLKYFLSYKHAFYLCMVFPAIVFVISSKANCPIIETENEIVPVHANT
ncbi:MAG: MFS transporter [Candidatus Kuenenia sp.]|nr:MFS transporter [Candidatus Kuenenia hertensis]